jgi:AbrB family looped-hinge helix DNA binding protein
MTTATISSKGWIVVPAGLRKKYHLQPGTRVALVDYGGRALAGASPRAAGGRSGRVAEE